MALKVQLDPYLIFVCGSGTKSGSLVFPPKKGSVHSHSIPSIPNKRVHDIVCGGSHGNTSVKFSTLDAGELPGGQNNEGRLFLYLIRDLKLGTYGDCRYV